MCFNPFWFDLPKLSAAATAYSVSQMLFCLSDAVLVVGCLPSALPLFLFQQPLSLALCVSQQIDGLAEFLFVLRPGGQESKALESLSNDQLHDTFRSKHLIHERVQRAA